VHGVERLAQVLFFFIVGMVYLIVTVLVVKPAAKGDY